MHGDKAYAALGLDVIIIAVIIQIDFGEEIRELGARNPELTQGGFDVVNGRLSAVFLLLRLAVARDVLLVLGFLEEVRQNLLSTI